MAIHIRSYFDYLLPALKAMLIELTPKYIDIVVTDKERSLAMTALHCLQEMLDSIGEPVLAVSDDTFTSIVSAVKDVLRGKVCERRRLLAHPIT